MHGVLSVTVCKFLERRFMSCAVGCRVRVRVSEKTQKKKKKTRNEYGKKVNRDSMTPSHAFQQNMGYRGIDPPQSGTKFKHPD